MCICERILKEGGCYIAEAITNAMAEYNHIRRRVARQKNGKERFMKIGDLDHTDSGRLPDGCADIYELDPDIIRSLNLYPHYEKYSSADLRQTKQRTAADDFRRSLAFRAKTMHQIRYLVVIAKDRAEQLAVDLVELLEGDELSDEDVEDLGV